MAPENPYVTFPSFATIDALSEAFAAPGDGILTAGDAMTSHINIRDYDATNKAIPQVYSDLLTYAGIIMVFQTSTGVDGTPYTELKILRPMRSGPRMRKIYTSPTAAPRRSISRRITQRSST